MIILEARHPTALPGRMILKLCKHFRHKVPAEFSEQQGRVDFQPGACLMLAEGGELLLRIEGADEQQIGRLKYILEDHLQRFERVPQLGLDWQVPHGDAPGMHA